MSGISKFKAVLIAAVTAAVIGPCVRSETEKSRIAEQQRKDVLEDIVLDEDKRIAFYLGDSICVVSPDVKYSERRVFNVGRNVKSLVWGSDNAIYFVQKAMPNHFGDCTARYVLKQLCLHEGAVSSLIDSCSAGFSEITHLRIDDDRLYFKTGAGCASVNTNGSDLRAEPFLRGSDQVFCSKGRHDLMINGGVYIRRGDVTIYLGYAGNIAVWEGGR